MRLRIAFCSALGLAVTAIALLPGAAVSKTKAAKNYQYYLKNLVTNPVSHSGKNGPAAGLGYGFSTDRDMPVLNCLELDHTSYGGSSEGLVDVARNYSLQEVKQQLHLTTDTSVDVGIFDADLKTDFVHNAETDKYSESFIYRTSIKLKNSIYNPPGDPNNVLNGIGKLHFNQGVDNFRNFCGDKFIYQLYWGGYLYVEVAMNFVNASDKKTFDAEMSASVADIVDMSAHLSTATSKINKDGTITIRALQVGGDPTQLGKILGGGGGSAPVVECSFDNMDKCQQLLNNVITYATSTEGDNFPTQIKIGGEETPVTAAVLGSDKWGYDALVPITPAASKVTPEILAARKTLADDLEQNVNDLKRAKFLLAHSDYQPYKDKVQALIPDLQTNQELIDNAGQVCFAGDFATNCVSNEKQILAKLHPIDRDILAGPNIQIYHVKFGIPQDSTVWSPTLSAYASFATPSFNFNVNATDLRKDAKTAKIIDVSNVKLYRYTKGIVIMYPNVSLYLQMNGSTVPYSTAPVSVQNGSAAIGLTISPPTQFYNVQNKGFVNYTDVGQSGDTYFSADVEVQTTE